MKAKAIKDQINELIKEYFFTRESHSPRVNVAWPCFGHEEVISAVDSILDLKLSQGDKVLGFEKNFSDYIGTEFGVAVNSGSSANLLALGALIKSGKIKPGSEVIVPAATFTTVVSPIIQNGLKPVFVDIEEGTYNIAPDSIKNAINKNTGLIMVVHSLGCPANMKEILKIAEESKIPILEDCCEAHGAAIDKKKVGSFGLISTFSFFVAHNITTGEGGMILTNDKEIDKILRSMREFGRFRPDRPMQRFGYSDDHLKDYDERYVFELIGYNVRMTDICASFGIEQLKKLDALNEERRKIVDYYDKHLAKYSKFLITPNQPQGFYHSFYGYPLLIKKNSSFSRTDLIRFLESRGIETRAFMGGNLTLQPAYRNEDIIIGDALNVTKNIANNAFFIGCHPYVSQNHREQVISAFDAFFKKIQDG